MSESTPSPEDTPMADAGVAAAALDPLAEAKAQAEEHYAQYLRAVAELDNVRKRAVRDVEQASRYAIERFAQELLPAIDSFELAKATGTSADIKTLLEGQEATYRLLQKAFEKCGIRLLDPTGQPFDPAEHEAMVAAPSAEHAPGTVMQTIQTGYLLNGRLLRPARVIVSRAPEGESGA
jgi:molecular chaperone GrpE